MSIRCWQRRSKNKDTNNVEWLEFWCPTLQNSSATEWHWSVPVWLTTIVVFVFVVKAEKKKIAEMDRLLGVFCSLANEPVMNAVCCEQYYVP